MSFCSELEKMRQDAINYLPMTSTNPIKSNLEIDQNFNDLMHLYFTNCYEKLFWVWKNYNNPNVDKPKIDSQTTSLNLTQTKNTYDSTLISNLRVCKCNPSYV